MGIILTIFYSVIFIILIYKWRFFRIEGFPRKAILFVFVLKIISGFVLYFIYTFYYPDRATADIFRYFDDSVYIYKVLPENPFDYIRMVTGINCETPHFAHYYLPMKNWYRPFENTLFNDNQIITRLNAFLMLFSFGYYHVHTVFMCFISLTGLTALYKFFIPYFSGKKKELFFAVFLIPSVVFWTSGVLKEGLLIAGLGLLLYYFGNLIKNPKSLKSILLLVAGLYILIFTKIYILMILVPLIISYFWVGKYAGKPGVIYPVIKYMFVIIVSSFIVLNIKQFLPEYDILKILVRKQASFINLVHIVNSGSIMDINILKPDIINFLSNMPQAFYNTFFRPYFFESSSPLILMAGIENLMIFIICLFSLIFIKTDNIKTNINLFLFSLFFVVMTFSMIGLITPVYGAIIRYKVPALPFLLLLCIISVDKEKIIKKIPFLKNFLNK